MGVAAGRVRKRHPRPDKTRFFLWRKREGRVTDDLTKAAACPLTQALRGTLASQVTEVHRIHPDPISAAMGAAAGLEKIAEPPSHIGEALVAAMAKGEFRVFSDSMARQIGEAYAGYAPGVIEAAGGG